MKKKKIWRKFFFGEKDIWSCGKTLKNQNVTKLKKHKMWHNSKNQNVTKFKNSKCERKKNQKLNVWQNYKKKKSQT